jgi:hypothetical protein
MSVGVASRGFGAVDPVGGTSRAARGYVGEYPEGIEPDPPVVLDPIPLLSTDAFDSNGIPRLLDNDIQAMCFWNADQDVFANPDKEYTGYGADGFWYEDGELDPAAPSAPTPGQFKAPWAIEGEGSATVNRGTLDRFPDRIFVVATRKEVAIFDADSLDVWMRFEIGVTPATAGKGKAFGNADIVIRDIAYANGVILAATNKDVRLIEFGWDRATSTGEPGDIWSSGGTSLTQRNADDYLGTGPSVDPQLSAVGTEFFSVALRPYSYGKDNTPTTVRGALTVGVVGSNLGVTAITFGAAWRSSRQHITSLSECGLSVTGGWQVIDDGDGDGYSRFIGDTAGTNWRAKSVRAGDLFFVSGSGSGVTAVVTNVDQITPGNRLVMDREFSVGTSGSSYTIGRRIEAVYLDADLSVYVANGPNAISGNKTLDWFWADPSSTPSSLFVPDPTTGLVWRGSTAPTVATSYRANDLARRGSTTYMATDIGVHSVSDADLADERASGFTYSTTAVTEFEAEYRILQGSDQNAKAVAVDPETGNISVAVTDFESVVTEINPSIEQAFRFFDQVGRVRALVTYRNPDGPPDEEIS